MIVSDVCIVSAKRTPIGRFLGALSGLTSVDLAVHAAASALSAVPRSMVDQVIVGNVLSAGQGMNVARQIGVRLDLPLSTPAFTVNMMCGSGLQAVLLGAQSIQAGHADVVLCGGTESMSQSPHILPRSRTGVKFGDKPLIDTVLRDGLVDAFSGEHMATTAERLASRYGISRQQQDDYALLSQQRCAASVERNAFAEEIVALPELAVDEHPRPDTTAEHLSDLRPAFSNDGTITAGNASGINDGSAMLLLARECVARQNGWPVLARLTAATVIGCDPAEMGLGPVHAVRRLCETTGTGLNVYDEIEINEAFAAQTLACLHELKLGAESVNVSGGAIALGHPIGSSGARLAVHLSQKIAAGTIGTGLAALCVGGGMGIAVSLASGR
ncbi:MAG: acetyl-CoA C-acyltransferase [Planctomycetaceae bacterium]